MQTDERSNAHIVPVVTIRGPLHRDLPSAEIDVMRDNLERRPQLLHHMAVLAVLPLQLGRVPNGIHPVERTTSGERNRAR